MKKLKQEDSAVTRSDKAQTTVKNYLGTLSHGVMSFCFSNSENFNQSEERNFRAHLLDPDGIFKISVCYLHLGTYLLHACIDLEVNTGNTNIKNHSLAHLL